MVKTNALIVARSTEAVIIFAGNVTDFGVNTLGDMPEDFALVGDFEDVLMVYSGEHYGHGEVTKRTYSGKTAAGKTVKVEVYEE